MAAQVAWSANPSIRTKPCSSYASRWARVSGADTGIPPFWRCTLLLAETWEDRRRWASSNHPSTGSWIPTARFVPCEDGTRHALPDRPVRRVLRGGVHVELVAAALLHGLA